MSEFNNLVEMITKEESFECSTINNENISQNNDISISPGEPFDIKTFASELKTLSEDRNKKYFESANTISGYSIAHDCIMCTIKKILNYPVKSFAHKWLPIMMRSTIGTAIHDFIQTNSTQFTELEPSIKVPSIRFSGRIDALISNNILVEIKSCTYTDYEKIIRKRQPRLPDFLQTMTYKYILENHLEEAKNPGVKTRTQPPKLDKYKIDKIQFIYIAHDICSADIEDFGLAQDLTKKFKKQLGVKKNDFPFISSVVLDTNCFDEDLYLNWIKEKMEAINYYIDNNKLPEEDNKFVDTKKCFFCLYNDNCELCKK